MTRGTHARTLAKGLVVVTTLLLFAPAGGLHASDDDRGSAFGMCQMFGMEAADVTIWRGTGNFRQSKSGYFKGGFSNERSSASVIYDETLEASAQASLCVVSCGAVGMVRGTIEHADFVYERTDSFSSQSSGDGCIEKSTIDARQKGVVDPALGSAVGGTLSLSPDGSYELLLSVTPLVYYLSGYRRENSGGCSKPKNTMTLIEPNLEPSVTGPPERALIHVPSPHAQVGFPIYEEGHVVKGRITGTHDPEPVRMPASSRAVKPLDGNDDQEYVEKTFADWTLSGVSLCDDLEEALRQDLAFLMAHEHVSPMIDARERGMDRHGYEKLVDQFAAKIYYESWDPSGSDAPSSDHSIDMYVRDKDCVLKGADERRRKGLMSCEHEVIFESILKHEETHVQQCEDHHAQYASNSAASFGKFEAEAYCAGAGHLLSALQLYCPGRQTPYADLYSNLCT